MPKRIDLVGQRFSRLVVKSHSHTSDGIAHWVCLCDCGHTCIIITKRLRRGETKSCGCYRRESSKNRKPGLKHGMSKTATHNAWASMLKRCRNPKNYNYALYGGRGITVCERWHKFENFFTDMGEKPEGLTLDRIDNNGNYEHGNCRWATMTQQANNRRTNWKICINGEIRTIAEWSRLNGIHRALVRIRLLKGWPPEKAIIPFIRHK